MKFTLRSDDLKELIYEHALPENFKSAHGLEEKKRHISLPIGYGTSEEVWFEGVHLQYGCIEPLKDVVVKAEADTPLIEMHFHLAGFSNSYLSNGREHLAFRPGEHNIFYAPEYDGFFEIKKQPTTCDTFEVHFTEAYFKSLMQADNARLENFGKKISGKQDARMYKKNRTITPEMEAIIKQLVGCRKQGVLKRLFMESKVLELLLLQLEQVSEEDAGVRATSLKPLDVEKIWYARELLEKNISCPLSLLELAQQAGLNDFKLKKGFKEVFGNTVFGYLHELRMQQARQMLLDENKTIREVAEYCGYEYVQHFTTAFRKKFGNTPARLRMKDLSDNMLWLPISEDEAAR
jgi:AraC-like DNA-binding protein